MGSQVWLTTATEDARDFFAVDVDAETGQSRFNETVFHNDTGSRGLPMFPGNLSCRLLLGRVALRA
jgi:hypothetical protein